MNRIFQYSLIGLSTACIAISNFGFAAQPPQKFKKAMLVVLENTDYDEAVRQTYLAQLVWKGALLTHFQAEGHPSQPNYVAMISGSTHGIFTDFPTDLSGKNLGDLLEAKGLGWKVYAEDYPGNCFQGSSSGRYVRKHNPFISFKDIQKDPQRCSRIVEAAQLDSDIQNGKLPEFSMYIPNLDNDGHDTTPAYADHWLATRFEKYLEDPKFSKDMLFIVTFDESETTRDQNRVFTVLLGPSVLPNSTSPAPYSHYSILRTIEDEFGLGTLGQNDAKASSIADIWN